MSLRVALTSATENVLFSVKTPSPSQYHQNPERAVTVVPEGKEAPRMDMEPPMARVQ
jgi:hypothetical protein